MDVSLSVVMNGLGFACHEGSDTLESLQGRNTALFQPGDEVAVPHGLQAEGGTIETGSRAIRLDLDKQLFNCRVEVPSHKSFINSFCPIVKSSRRR
jgi:hypothetical protein